ncbi:MAG: hypothetical protein AAF652_13690 [Cyanobacteria bacterium P01_C01_bin.72]
MLISNLKFGSVLNQLKAIGLAIALAAGLLGCQTPLIVVEEISPKKVNQIVYLTGKVVHQAPFLDNAAYQLEDDTGKVWVVTTQNLPRLHQKINIKGKIQYQSLPFAQQELGDFYVVELEQLSSL